MTSVVYVMFDVKFSLVYFGKIRKVMLSGKFLSVTSKIKIFTEKKNDSSSAGLNFRSFHGRLKFITFLRKFKTAVSNFMGSVDDVL